MPRFRRILNPGGTYFLTLGTFRRRPILATQPARTSLRQAVEDCRERWPFVLEAIVLLPDHLHAILTLPQNDVAYATRIGFIKKEFTKQWKRSGGAAAPISPSQRKDRRSGVWQRRFWEHVIQDDNDLQHHLDYLHFNPVKHGLVERVAEWPWSSFHRLVRQGVYPGDWACGTLAFHDIAEQAGE